MKIDTIRIIVYGAFIIGALMMFSAPMSSILSNYATIFMYIGGAVVVFGMVFCVNCLRFSACTNCKEFIYFRDICAKNCPLCDEGKRY